MKTNLLKTALLSLAILCGGILKTQANGLLVPGIMYDNDYILGYYPDTTKIKLGKKSIIIVENEKSDTVMFETDSLSYDTLKEKKYNGHWAGIELGLNNYINDAGNLNLSKENEFLKLNPGKSWAFSFNFAEFNIPLYKSFIGLTTGMGLTINNYRFENDITLFKNSDTLSYFIDTTRNILKNKLTTTSLIVPLLLEFQLPVFHTRLNFAVGGYAGVRVGGHTKQVFKIDGVEATDKVHDGFYTNPWKYGLTARLGGEDLQFFINYDMSTMFEENRGPKLYPITVGVTLLNL